MILDKRLGKEQSKRFSDACSKDIASMMRAISTGMKTFCRLIDDDASDGKIAFLNVSIPLLLELKKELETVSNVVRCL